MQSRDARQLILASDRAQIERTVRQLLIQRTRSDIESMLSIAHPEIVYTVHGGRSIYPFADRHKGIDELRRLFIIVVTEFDNHGSVIHKLLIDGSMVAVERTATLQHRGTNAVAEIDIVDFLRFQDGMIIEFSEHADTLAIERLKGKV